MQGSVGTNSMLFSKLVTSSKAASMGNAVSGMSHYSAMFMNPASLASNTETILTSQYFYYVDDIAYKQFQFMQPSLKGNMALSYIMLDYGTYSQTTISDKAGTQSGNVANESSALVLTYAAELHDFNYGISVKYLKERLGRYTGKQVGVDIGGQLILRHNLIMGASITDISLHKIKYERESAHLQHLDRVGVYYTPEILNSALSISADIVAQNGKEFRVATGFSLALHPAVTVRGGYHTLSDLFGLSLGIGVTLENMDIDISYRPNKTFNDCYRVGMKLSL